MGPVLRCHSQRRFELSETGGLCCAFPLTARDTDAKDIGHCLEKAQTLWQVPKIVPFDRHPFDQLEPWRVRRIFEGCALSRPRYSVLMSPGSLGVVLVFIDSVGNKNQFPSLRM